MQAVDLDAPLGQVGLGRQVVNKLEARYRRDISGPIGGPNLYVMDACDRLERPLIAAAGLSIRQPLAERNRQPVTRKLVEDILDKQQAGHTGATLVLSCRVELYLRAGGIACAAVDSEALHLGWDHVALGGRQHPYRAADHIIAFVRL